LHQNRTQATSIEYPLLKLTSNAPASPPASDPHAKEPWWQELRRWNATQAPFPEHLCAHDLFAAQAALTPECTALICGEHSLSYSQLDTLANRLAHHLRSLGVGPDVLVALSVERSLASIVGLLGILKAGGAYLPLDPDYPRQRLELILADAEIGVLLTQRSLREHLPTGRHATVELDDWAEPRAEAAAAPSSGATPENLAYVIYTSGSTGKPKGVAMSHRPLVNLVSWQRQQSSASQGSRTLQLASLSFDVSVQEIFATLCTGATLVLVPDAVRRDPRALLRLIAQRSVERIFLTFTALQQLAETALREHDPVVGLREIMTAGEQLRITPPIAAWLRRLDGCRLYNQYGPTETHVVMTSYPLLGNPSEWPELPPIGRPIANTQVYILDSRLQPVAPGAIGEICIGGACLARGYLNQPELTAERFIADPFTDGPARRLYRSGDLGRYLPDGNIEFVGRCDEQVKVRGFRIELGEVEAALNRHSGVARTAVAARCSDGGDARLVAYIVPSSDTPPSTAALRDFLLGQLPEHMLPSAFVTLDALPETPSGKVDRKALPEPETERPALGNPLQRPRNPLEHALAAIWTEVLDLDELGITDNFFELGGDSLRATRVLARIDEVLLTELTHATFFANPTIRELAACIEALRQRTRTANPRGLPARRAPGSDRLSIGEKGIWLAAQLAAGQPIYNESFTLHFSEEVRAPALEQALNAFVARHELLRTGFAVAGGTVFRRLRDTAPLQLSVVDLGCLDAQTAEAEFASRAQRDARRSFDLGLPPLMRASMYRLGEGRCRLHLVVHHLVFDAHAIYAILLPELHALYEAFSRGRTPELPPPSRPFGDYVGWQHAYEDSEAIELDRQYWEHQLQGIRPLGLATDRRRPQRCSYRGAFTPFSLPVALSEALAALGRRERSSMFTVLLSAFEALLWRYTGEEDIAVGTVQMDRQLAGFESVFGCFLNTLVLRTSLSGNPCFTELLERVRKLTLEALAHCRYPFSRLLEGIPERRDPSRHPLFQVAFVMEPSLDEHPSGWTVSQLDVQHGTAKFDLLLELEQRRDGLIGRFEYNTDLFDHTTIERMVAHYRALLEGIVAHPDRRLSELPLLGAAERSLILRDWNDTAAPLPRQQSVHELFEVQAERRPESVAIADGERSLSYAELNARANQLARYLRRRGVGPDVLVGLCMPRSLDMVIAALGILKSGGAYVPLDPCYPAQRLAWMFADSRAPVVLTHATLKEQLPPYDGDLICVDNKWHEIAREPFDNLRQLNTAGDLAYVVYTSGSTGTPKGVAVPHRGVVRLVYGCDYVAFGPEQTHLLLSPISFDAATFELWGALLHGARCIVFADRVPTMHALGRSIREHRVTTLWLTAALFNTVIDQDPQILAGVAELVTGGEALSLPHVRRALAKLPRTRLINGYGPTESTTFSCCFRIPPDLPHWLDSVPIGRPIGNTRVYVLDAYLNPVPVGVPGELFIAGDGLARGYLNRPELSAKRFVADPFDREPDARMYRTGDRVRYLADGNIEFLGRMDEQLKIRGWRIEPREIEITLLQHAAVSAALVMARSEPEGLKLAAYVVPHEGHTPSARDLQDFLRTRLPAYMLPSALVLLDRLPLTPNGKVDRDALPAPVQRDRDGLGEASSPGNAIEVQLMRIWEQLLRISPIGVEENFFDLGGHSLLAVQLMDRIARLFDRQLPLDSLWYGRGTIRHLAEMLTGDDADPVWMRPIAIKASGERPPLFCVPIAGGHVFNYDNMSPYVDAEQPLYGLPLQGVDGRQQPHRSIETIALHCITQMRSAQPFGPYHLAGYCSGGVIAFEMARQLHAQGETVAFVGLIDSAPPWPASTLRAMLRDLIRGKELRLVQERFYALALNAMRLPRLRRLKGVGESHRWALWSYRPQPFVGRLTVFRPAEYEYSRDAALGWASLAEQGVEVHVLPGRHRDLVKEPGVQRLAQRLNACLAAAQSRPPERVNTDTC